MLVAYLNNDFVVELKHHPKKSKRELDTYDLYLMFTITQKGFILGTTEFNVNKSCSVEQWANPKTLLKGITTFTKTTNTTLYSYENRAKMFLEKANNWNSCEEIKSAIQTTVRTGITGKAARGKKRIMAEKLKGSTVEHVIERMKTTLRRGEKPLGESRKRLYDSVYEVLKEFFSDELDRRKVSGAKNSVPALLGITRQHLQNFKNWYYKTYKHKAETRSTYLGVIAAIFRYAADELELIPFSPIPKGFTPMVKKKDRNERLILEESDIKKVYALQDQGLNYKELVAKYIMMLQVSTGMAYCDITSLSRGYIKRNNISGDWQIRKPRAKSGEIFTVVLSARAKYAYDNLISVAGGTETVFDLPKLRVVNKQYKKIASYAEIHPFTSYTLRHTFAVHFMDYGGKMEDLADILGHASLESTRIYGKISESRRSQTMRKITAESLIHQL